MVEVATWYRWRWWRYWWRSCEDHEEDHDEDHDEEHDGGGGHRGAHEVSPAQQPSVSPVFSDDSFGEKFWVSLFWFYFRLQLLTDCWLNQMARHWKKFSTDLLSFKKVVKLTNWCLAAPARSRSAQKVEPGIWRKPYSELCRPDTRCFQDWTSQVRRRWLEMSVTRCKWEIGFCHLEMTRLQSGSPFASKCADVRTRANPQFQKIPIGQFLFC